MKGRTIFFAILTVILPFILLMNSVVLVFTVNFLTYEYKKPDFPPDPFGFTLEQRIKYGTASVNYITDVFGDYNDDYFAGLKKEDGTPLFNERELSHMKDVKTVFQTARLVLAVMMVFVILTIYLVSQNPDSLKGFLKALIRGGILTIVIITAVIVLIFTGFDAFFDGFHRIFFTGESWLFYENDSLIRLFPEMLWVDGFSMAALFTLIFAVLIGLVAYLALRKLRPSKHHAKQRQ